MIIFDSNALFGLSPDAPKFDLLRAIKRSGRQKVGIPWVVLEELVGQKVLAEAAAFDKAVSAVRDLNRLAPRLRQPTPRSFSKEAARTFWRTQYGRLFEVIPTSGEAALQALAREAHCEKPAKSPDAKEKGGARDVAIWLSAIEYLQKHPDDKVYFVTANKRDFGDGSSFPSPMAEDLMGLEDRLELLSSFEEVVAKFTTRLDIDEKHIEDVLVGMLTREEALSPLEAALKDVLIARSGSWGGTEVNGLFAGLTPDSYAPTRWSSWLTAPSAYPRGVQDVEGHKIGDEEWYSATVDWILVGFANRPPVVSPSAPLVKTPTPVACQLRTRLLFSSKSDEAITVLQYFAPTALDPAEKAAWEPLVLKGLQTPASTGTALGLLLVGLAAFVKSKRTDLGESEDSDE